MKHTPGPWRVVRANPSPTSGEWMIAGGKPGYLAEVRDCGSGNVEANASLIAAAPELLEALRAITDQVKRNRTFVADYGHLVSAARAALAKAGAP